MIIRVPRGVQDLEGGPAETHPVAVAQPTVGVEVGAGRVAVGANAEVRGQRIGQGGVVGVRVGHDHRSGMELADRVADRRPVGFFDRTGVDHHALVPGYDHIGVGPGAGEQAGVRRPQPQDGGHGIHPLNG